MDSYEEYYGKEEETGKKLKAGQEEPPSGEEGKEQCEHGGMCQAKADLCSKCNNTKIFIGKQIQEQRKHTVRHLVGLETDLSGKVEEVSERVEGVEERIRQEKEERRSREEEHKTIERE